MYYSISQAAFLLGVCTTTIRRWDKQGLINVYGLLETTEEYIGKRLLELLQVRNAGIRRKNGEWYYMEEFPLMSRNKKGT